MKLAMVVVVAMSGRAWAESGVELGMRMPWDVTRTPGVVSVGLGGLGLDLGERVGERLYLGAMVDYELAIRIDDAGGGIEHRFRGGVEGRYYFHEGTATVGGGSDDCCCHVGDPVTVPRHDWVGLRLGEETVDQLATHGQFADLSLGTDAQIGGTQVGMYLSAGITREPSAAYATEPAQLPHIASPAPDPSVVTSYYVTLGIHMAFGG